MNILLNTVISFFVSLCIGFMLNTKPKTSLTGAILGGLSYGIFLLCGSERLGYFTSALVLSLLSEVMAKILKTPSTLFLIIGIYPLVPGMGIYKTIFSIVASDYQRAINLGGDTFVNLALMATAIALISIVFGRVTEERFKRNRNYLPDHK